VGIQSAKYGAVVRQKRYWDAGGSQMTLYNLKNVRFLDLSTGYQMLKISQNSGKRDRYQVPKDIKVSYVRMRQEKNAWNGKRA
jgi:hypothetical protein